MTSSVPATSAPPGKPRRRWPALLAIGFFALVALGGLSFVVASTLEDHDSFCISCHTAPETTYFNRAYMSLDNPAADPPDLASWHYLNAQAKQTAAFTCIMCHRGDASLGQRVSTLALGGRDAMIFAVGKQNSTLEKTQISEGWLANASCIGCHMDTLLTLKGLDNHFHTQLPQAATALANGGTLKVSDSINKEFADRILQAGLQTVNTTLLCSDCHQPHKSFTRGTQLVFMATDTRNQACVTCHKAAGKGPQDAKSLG